MGIIPHMSDKYSNEEMEALRPNLIRAVKMAGTNYKKLSLDAGLGETAIRDIITGRSKSPKISTLFKIKNALGEYGAELNIKSDSLIEKLAPVYGYASGTNNTMALNDGAIFEYVPCYNPLLGNDGFYMIVVGDSMEPRYEQGERIAVSRSIPPRKGRDCVIEFKDGTAAVKRYISKTDDKVTCEQLNPQKAVIYNLAEIKAIYAVVGREG